MVPQRLCRTLLRIKKLTLNILIKLKVVAFLSRLFGALFSLTTGAAVAVIINVLNTHDVKLARLLYQFLNPGDVLLGDCAFCSYADIVFVQTHAREAVFRQPQTRKSDVKRDRRQPLSSYDRIEVWHKPKTRAYWFVTRGIRSTA